jgi:hypothetical protein
MSLDPMTIATEVLIVAYELHRHADADNTTTKNELLACCVNNATRLQELADRLVPPRT